MGQHSDDLTKCAIEEAYAGPPVSAAPGYFLLFERDPERAPEPILAWRIGREMVLPVTGTRCIAGQHHVLYPDGSVWPHFLGYGYDPGTFKSFAEWHDRVTGQNEPPKQEPQAATTGTSDIPS
jgi:hypothetical protein